MRLKPIFLSLHRHSPEAADLRIGEHTLTKRAFILGLGLSTFANLWPAYSSLIVLSSRADHMHLSVGMLIPFVILLLVNVYLEARGTGLSSSELLTVCCMSLVAAWMQGEGLSGYLLGVITAPYYFASPENRWEELLLQYLPSWAIITDRELVRGFYEGLPPGESVPWAAWVPPAFWWASLVGSVLTVNLCVSVLFRKQWMDHEKLAYPIATALLQLTGASSGETGKLSALLKHRLFRVGFSITFVIIGWNVTTWFVTGLPLLPILAGRPSKYLLTIAPGFPNIVFAFSLMTFTFGYFTRSEVLFSIWFFHVLAIIQAGIFNRLGYDFGSSDPWCSFHPAVGWQGFGGMIVLVLWGIWMGRAHFRDVWRHAIGRASGGDDDELMSYRTTVVLLILGLGFGGLWLNRSGMALGPLLTFGFGTAVLYIGLSRIIAESGLVAMRGPITAQAFVWHTFGITGLGPLSAAALSLTFAWFCDGRGLGVTAFAHVARLSAAMDRTVRRLLGPSILTACAIGAFAVCTYIIYEGYHATGGFNFGTVSFESAGSQNGFGISNLTASRIQQGTFSTDWTRVSYLGIGAIFSALLFGLRYQFPGFPIHPIGFTVAAAPPVADTVSTIFLIWAVKSLVLRIGGLERYRAGIPLILGLLIGYLAGVSLGLVVDIIWFSGQGHQMHMPW